MSPLSAAFGRRWMVFLDQPGYNGDHMAYIGQRNAWHCLLRNAFRFNKIALGAMSLMCLLPRYIIFTLGETVVGVAMLPLLLGLGLVEN